MRTGTAGSGRHDADRYGACAGAHRHRTGHGQRGIVSVADRADACAPSAARCRAATRSNSKRPDCRLARSRCRSTAAASAPSTSGTPTTSTNSAPAIRSPTQQILTLTVPPAIGAGVITVQTNGGIATLQSGLTVAAQAAFVPSGDVGDTLATATAITLPVDANIAVPGTVGDGANGAKDVDLYQLTLARRRAAVGGAERQCSTARSGSSMRLANRSARSSAPMSTQAPPAWPGNSSRRRRAPTMWGSPVTATPATTRRWRVRAPMLAIRAPIR